MSSALKPGTLCIAPSLKSYILRLAIAVDDADVMYAKATEAGYQIIRTWRPAAITLFNWKDLIELD